MEYPAAIAGVITGTSRNIILDISTGYSNTVNKPTACVYTTAIVCGNVAMDRAAMDKYAVVRCVAPDMDTAAVGCSVMAYFAAKYELPGIAASTYAAAATPPAAC